MILTEEESSLKKIIWDNLNKDWIKDQKKRRRERKEKRKLEKQMKKKSQRVKSKFIPHINHNLYLENAIKFEASNPTEAIMKSQRFANLNPLVINSLFKKEDGSNFGIK